MVEIMNWGAWSISGALALWMSFDLLRTNRTFGEDYLLSSEEGEIVDTKVAETAVRS
jgi:hypothetical protein